MVDVDVDNGKDSDSVLRQGKRAQFQFLKKKRFSINMEQQPVEIKCISSCPEIDTQNQCSEVSRINIKHWEKMDPESCFFPWATRPQPTDRTLSLEGLEFSSEECEKETLCSCGCAVFASDPLLVGTTTEGALCAKLFLTVSAIAMVKRKMLGEDSGAHQIGRIDGKAGMWSSQLICSRPQESQLLQLQIIQYTLLWETIEN
ncbi:uncharacterized protein LOC119928751 [Tachyglossus aculeatus]|uniref:uncharacterized protein LOC119928751 n=1 Tax=Tachyglossus aculeatus TaxID=9261 RepID=UPI0018F497F2|nr:uncharacterized protein LOC119928751 [Tachyglossus aculeatus]